MPQQLWHFNRRTAAKSFGGEAALRLKPRRLDRDFGARDYGFEKMINKLSCRALIALALIASTSLLLPQSSQACGPFFTDAIFVYTKHPDFPLERFAKGQLGVLRPSYARS